MYLEECILEVPVQIDGITGKNVIQAALEGWRGREAREREKKKGGDVEKEQQITYMCNHERCTLSV